MVLPSTKCEAYTGINMCETVLAERRFPTEIVQAFEEQERVSQSHPDIPLYLWEASQEAARTLLRWEAPRPLAVAALVTPLVQHEVPSSQAPSVLSEKSPVQMARALVALPLHGRDLEIEPEPSGAQHCLKLRRLFRWAHIDMDLVILATAFHDAMLAHRGLPDDLEHYLACETENVFVPLSEMLGLWALRRTWLDRSAVILGRYESSKERRLRRIGDGLRKSRRERAKAFAQLREELQVLIENCGIEPQIHLREPQAGSVLWRVEEGEPLEEMTDRLTVAILCDFVEDCYLALGLVHRLGRPIAPRFSERFDDYIASPQPNGYQCLHTAIAYAYRGSRSQKRMRMLTQFRILTQPMDKTNEWGAIKALYGDGADHSVTEAWWNRKERLSSLLRDQYRLQYRIDEFMSKYQLDSRPHPASLDRCAQESCPILGSDEPPPHPVYAFTPRGEVILLSDGATALDFAYHLHSEIGHGASKIWVNGQSVPHYYPLRNGDIVRVEFDSTSAGLDFDWLDLAATKSANRFIRQGLVAQAQRIHEGRSQILQALMKVLRFYEREKDYRLRFTTKRLDTFLLGFAEARGLSDVGELYSEVASERISPHKLVHRLISEELMDAIADRQERPISTTYPRHRISICGTCRPVPGEPIVARERRSGVETLRLTVHQADSATCRGVPTADEGIPLQWMQAPSSHTFYVQMQIMATDRPRILGDVLNEIYFDKGLYAVEVNARAHAAKEADIAVVVTAENWNQLVGLRTRVESIPYVHNVHMSPLSHPRQLALSIRGSGPTHDRIPNPYTEHEVYGRSMFYDRDVEIDTILQWLETQEAKGWLVIHGQRRVGKTSLARHLAEVRLHDRRVVPVFVDLQALDRFTSERVVELILRSVCSTLQLPVPSPGPGEPPAIFLTRFLRDAAKKLGDRRLLIIVDEFSVLMSAESRGEATHVVFDNLRSVLSELRDVSFLLIVQDNHFLEDTRWGSAGNIFGEASTVSLQPFDEEWAKKLITVPLASQCQCTIEESVVEEILALASGVPYYVHILCKELIEHLNRQNRRRVTRNDLYEVLPVILSRGDRYFHHFAEHLQPHGRGTAVLAATAFYQKSGCDPALADIHADLTERGLVGTTLGAVQGEAEKLARHGMLEALDDGGLQRVRIPIGLFRRWVMQKLDLDAVVAEVLAFGQKRRR